MLELHTALPAISEERARAVLRERWGIDARLDPLPGERDRNFHAVAHDGREYVLKFSGSQDEHALLDLQNEAMAFLASNACPVATPRVVPDRDGQTVIECEADHGRALARVLTWLPGRPLAEWRPHTASLLHDLGTSLGRLTRTLSGFRHSAAARPLKWDLAHAQWIVGHLSRVEDPRRCAMLGRITSEYAATVQPALAPLRRSVTYNDANDYNILVEQTSPLDARISGIIDFGDLLETHTVCDLAIALAYSMLGKPDPLSAAAHVVRGYHEAFPLQEAEIALLFSLTRMRLSVSVVNSALQRAMAPGNAYLQVTDADAWALLDALDAEHERYATYRFRDACGLEPCAVSRGVAEWMSANSATFAPILDQPFAAQPLHVHDFSVSSTEIGTLDVWTDQERFSRHVDGVMREAGALAGVARYDEVRAIYTTGLFRVTGNDGPEWRTVHLGIDVNGPPGTPVHAPLDGVVHSVGDNSAPGDYGPTVVLEHRVDDTLTFWTLYGHLSRESIARLHPGDRIERAGAIGWVGDRTVNGGWWPHVHVQVICDLLGRTADYAGVSRPQDRSVWLSLCPDPSPLLQLPDTARAPRPETVESLSRRRHAHLGPSLSVSYRHPLNIVRGMMQHLISADGRRYLDAVNNVAHVGHAHPDVVRAAQRQTAVLNTNTRYLHGLLDTYAERLTGTLPPTLSVCYFVCSGSEANELALRLARAHTSARDVIVVDAGYHGNTSTLVDVSPYKFNGPGGAGAPDWVHVTPMPDTYRGAFGGHDPDAGMKYAQAVREAVGGLLSDRRRPAAFLCESILSCGGQIVLPPGYLAEAYRHVRAAGGVCIADEVQVGFGRVGSHMWAFETQGVVPDIVTMGKPIGNGHPLGAVITTPEIAASFANGMEYFNSFGGNPVSCAIGLEVLDVIEREQLRANARRVGEYLQRGLHDLMRHHALIGDVRGLGLFSGVELVTDRGSRVPARAQAHYVANRMRDLGVLMSSDGPGNNVLKIKPPMCFSEQDADTLVATLDSALRDTQARSG